MKHLPNTLTFIRFGLTAIGVAALLISSLPYHITIATTIFIVAALTDWIDGLIARQFNMTSKMGAFMDPLADKVLVLLYFVYLTNAELFPLWLLIMMLARDLINDGYRNFAASKRVILSATPLSKTKTALQMLSVTIVLLTMSANEVLKTQQSWHENSIQLGNILMIVAVILGIMSTIRFISRYSFILTSGE